MIAIDGLIVVVWGIGNVEKKARESAKEDKTR
jgi:hypothetical protein